jgi:lipopolysaccharide transport system ATP-binding protein
MKDDVVIHVDNVSKKYCKSLKRSMIYGISDIGRNMLGMKTGSHQLRDSEFWALKDVSLTVRKGESWGIIGANGSGKTTLLKMLNGIFWPDKGRVTIQGRVGALIAVGAGFHPLLTGRENIYMNGAILGMSKEEIDAKFEAIVDFSGVREFLDSPVKNYSSGMFVRLGFAVAVHCDIDILLVDEVLSVGDLVFRAKCLDKMREFKEKGKTIIFVSHQMHEVEKICDKVMVLAKGENYFSGEPNEAIDKYRAAISTVLDDSSEQIGSGEIVVKKVETVDAGGQLKREFEQHEPLTVRIHYEAKTNVSPIVSVVIYAGDGTLLTHMRTDADQFSVGPLSGRGYVDLKVDLKNLNPHFYQFSVIFLKEDRVAIYDMHFRKFHFQIKGGHKVHGLCHLNHEWSVAT